MGIFSKAKMLAYLASHPQLITSTTKYLFIFSHMRSRSSVLAHILGSNPEITGYTELQIPYTRGTDLIKMRALLFQEARYRIKDKYLLDKILHNKYEFSSQIFRIANPKIVFLLRTPKATIQSILNMASETEIKYYTTYEEALDYYCVRLLKLEALAKELAGEYFFIESDELVNNSDVVLYKLTDWLQLNHGLSKHYSIFEKTGLPGFGDPLENIKSGELRATPKHSNINIPKQILQKAELAYERCKQTLLYYTLPDLICYSGDNRDNTFTPQNTAALN